MASYEYSKAQVAESSGRPEASYTSYIDQAIREAVLLFKIGTCLASTDDLTDDQKALVDMGILKMADAIYLSQPFQAVAATPFSSESIGSYSYSKAAGAVSGGVPTGIFWFDKAIDEVGVCNINDPDITFGGIDIGGRDGVLVAAEDTNVLTYLTPGDLVQSRAWGFDPMLTR